MHSLTWVNEDTRKEYRALTRRTHAFKKTRFNVYFAKTWGSKAFFKHLVRFGTSSDIAEMLRVFGQFQKSGEYKQIVEANAEKSQEERRLKMKRDQLYKARKQSDYLEQQYLEAKEDYEALGRGSRGGVSQASWVDIVMNRIA